MHFRVWILLLLWCFALCSCISFTRAEELSKESTTEAVSKGGCVDLREALREPVQKWQVDDVSHWMTYTVGYPEYVGFVRKHMIDGPTLLSMELADIEEHFPIEHTLHAIKLGAHLRLLKKMCLCEQIEDAAIDFWSYMRRENFRVWIVGTLSLTFPRVAMLYTYVFDNELYELLLAVSVPQADALSAASQGLLATTSVPFLHKFIYFVCMIAAPNFFMVVEAARVLSTNYVIIPCFILRFLCNAWLEYFSLYLIYRDGFPSGTSLLQHIWDSVFFPLLILVVAVVLYPIIPFALQTVFVLLLAVHSVIVVVNVVCLVYQDFASSSKETEKNQN